MVLRMFLIGCAVGLAKARRLENDSGATEAKVEIPYGLLICSQALYFGLAVALSKHKLRWRMRTDEPVITWAAMVVVLLSLVQIFLIFLPSAPLVDALDTTGPLPILSAIVALWLYPIGYEQNRHLYGRSVGCWDADQGNKIRLPVLLNKRWKIVVYVLVVAGTIARTALGLWKSHNAYPLFSTITALLLFTILGTIPSMGHMDEIQRNANGDCELDTVTIPVIGWSRNTSFLVCTFNESGFRLERVQSPLDHSFWASTGFLYEIAAQGLVSSEYIRTGGLIKDVREYTKIVRSSGGWHKLSEETCRNGRMALDLLRSEEIFRNAHTRMYLWAKVCILSALKAAASRFEGVTFLLDERRPSNLQELVEFQFDQNVKGRVVLGDHQQNEIPDEIVDDFVASLNDEIEQGVALMLIFNMMGYSGDERLKQADTLWTGQDVIFHVNWKTETMRFDVRNEDERQIDSTDIAAECEVGLAQRAVQALVKQPTYGKSTIERVSAEKVPATLTSFKIIRQHIFKYILGYMGVYIIFVFFGESLKSNNP